MLGNFNLIPVDYDPFAKGRADGGEVSEDTISADLARRAAAQRTRDAVVRRLPARADGGRVDADNIDAEPTEAQKEAGNYRKDRVRVHGLGITIENAKGAERSGVGRDGKPWSVKMPAAYGYIRGTLGKDKDHVDVYVGPHRKAPDVFVIDQKDAETGTFDEHKAFVGFPSKQAAVACYRKSFSDGRADERLGHIEQMSVDAFKHWLANGDATKPIARAA
jgi:Inorganic Pyrophosphatase